MGLCGARGGRGIEEGQPGSRREPLGHSPSGTPKRRPSGAPAALGVPERRTSGGARAARL